MSRCFPFPPPGYERKIKADGPCLLKKDKHREKNQKKEKKDKKKESKEKLEKERTDEKHRGKKDKKEKHRDKKEKERDLYKDKHKSDSFCPDEKRAVVAPDVDLNKVREKSNDRGNDGSVTLGEKRVAGPSVCNNGVPVSKNYQLASQTKTFSNATGSVSRNTNEERRINNQLPNKNVSAERQKDPSVCNNGVPVSKNYHLASQTKTFSNATGSVSRNTNEERRINNQLPNKNVSAERQKDEVVKTSGTGAIPIVDGKEKTNEKPSVVEKMDLLGVTGKVKFSGNALGQNVIGPVKLPGKSQGPVVDGRERKEKHPIDGRMDVRTISGEARSSGSALPPNIVGVGQNKVGAMVRHVDKKLEQNVEREKVREKEGDHKKGEKRKEVDREKTIHKDKDKEKKKEEKVKATAELKKHVQMPSKRDGNENHTLIRTAKNKNKKDLSATLSDGLQSIPKPSTQGGATLLGKRKDIGLNGIYDEQMTGPNKLARTTTPTHPLTENGRSLEPCQNSAASARPPMNIKVERTFAPDETQRAPMNSKVDSKDCKINYIKTGPFTQCSQTTSRVEQKSQVSGKPPHPDAKYLSQVLTVPKLDEWPEFDDQEWLFSSNAQTRKPQAETSRVEEEPKVWASVLWLEPVDVFALPYVIRH